MLSVGLRAGESLSLEGGGRGGELVRMRLLALAILMSGLELLELELELLEVVSSPALAVQVPRGMWLNGSSAAFMISSIGREASGSATGDGGSTLRSLGSLDLAFGRILCPRAIAM